MSSRRNLVVGLGLASASVLFLLLALELFLRLTVENPADLYKNLTYNRSADTEYFQRSFLHLYTAEKEWKRETYDPYLGWDHNIENGRIRGNQTYSLQPDEDVFRIVTIGDSFTFGSQVAAEETYPFYVGTLLDNTEVLNMGVLGYGIDQAVLKYLKHGSQYEPDVVIFGILPHDYIRAGISFYGITKPVFNYNEETKGINLTNTNIRPPQQVFDDLKQKLGPPKLYAYAFVKNGLLRAYPRFINSRAKEQYYDEMDRIVEQILLMLLESTGATDTKLLVVQIPGGHHFSDEGALSNAKLGDTHTRLLNIYRRLDIPYVDLLEDFPASFSRDEVFNDLYIYQTGSTRGHFTPKGNLAVAQIIQTKLETIQ